MTPAKWSCFNFLVEIALLTAPEAGARGHMPFRGDKDRKNRRESRVGQPRGKDPLFTVGGVGICRGRRLWFVGIEPRTGGTAGHAVSHARPDQAHWGG